MCATNIKKLALSFIVLFALFSSTMAQMVPDAETKNTENYGEKGIIELYGGLSFSGNTTDPSVLKFSAQPGFNYFIARNIYMGVGLLAMIDRTKTKNMYPYQYKNQYKSNVNLGLSVPFGLVFRINDHAFFNLVVPEFQFDWYKLKSFRVYPVFTTSFKFPYDNALINVGINHNFFNFSEKSISKFYYSYDLFLGFSNYFDTDKRQTIEQLDANKPDTTKNRIAGSFFLSWLPVCSGSWLTGWDWGGLAFSIVKTAATASIIGYVGRPSKTPLWVFGFGFFALPIATLGDMIYSPCMVAYRLKHIVESPGNSETEIKKDNAARKSNNPEIMLNAAPRISLKKEDYKLNNNSYKNNMIDGVNIMIVRMF